MKNNKILIYLLLLLLLTSCVSGKDSNVKQLEKLVSELKITFKGAENHRKGTGHLFKYELDNDELQCDTSLPLLLTNGTKLVFSCYKKDDLNTKVEREVEINNLLIPITNGYEYNSNIHNLIYKNNLEIFPSKAGILREMHLTKFGQSIKISENKIGDISVSIYQQPYEWLNKRKDANYTLFTDNVFLLIYESLSNDPQFLINNTAGKKYILNVYNNIFIKPGNNYPKDSNDYALVELNYDDLSYKYIKGHPTPAISLFADDVKILKENIELFDQIMYQGRYYYDVEKLNPLVSGLTDETIPGTADYRN